MAFFVGADPIQTYYVLTMDGCPGNPRPGQQANGQPISSTGKTSYKFKNTKNS